MRIAAIARHIQPARKASPPSGVIAPNQRTPLRLSAYRLPQKMIVPTTKSQPLVLTSVPGHFVAAQAHTIEGERVIHLVPNGDFEDGEHVRREARFQRMRTERAGCHTQERGQRAEREEDPVQITLSGSRQAQKRRGPRLCVQLSANGTQRRRVAALRGRAARCSSTTASLLLPASLGAMLSLIHF